MLAGYLAFGQYWGVWVILVFDFQRFPRADVEPARCLYTMLSLTAVAVMLVGAPRLQRLPLTATVPLSMLVLAGGSFVIAYQPAAIIVLGRLYGLHLEPPLFGYVAQTIDLRAAMAVIVIATLGIIVAGLMAPRSRA